MKIQKLIILFSTLVFLNCNAPTQSPKSGDWEETFIRGALITTRFNSLEELKKVLKIKHAETGKPFVHLVHHNNGQTVECILKTGISEADIKKAKDGSFLSKASICLKSPFLLMKRKDLLRILLLARRRGSIFGENDVAFYDLAEHILHNISEEDSAEMSSKDLSEKGYFNTFNHITAQAFMTSLFSEKLADFVSDAHERARPELLTGVFTKEQLEDIENGPVDNYVDMINNKWGQRLGKILKKKHKITKDTHWTPELTASYFNDVQSYFSWAFQITFTPFKSSEEVIIKFTNKINNVMENLSDLQ